MKRSEFRKECRSLQAGDPRYYEEVVRRFMELTEKAGAQWDPEEPELPERVFTRDGVCALLWEGKAEIGERSDLYPVYREAAARYNAVEGILAHVEGIIHVDHLKRVLRRERERLQ